MTAKEAIMQIQAIPEKIWNQLSEPDNEAINMAISALQEQDSPKPTAGSVQNVQNEDLISRKAAIDAVEHITSSMSVCVNTDECHGMKRMQRQAVIELANLPSAQPERETAKYIRWMECKKTANYISYTPHCKCSKCGTEFIIETIKYCYMCGARMESI